MAGEAPNTPQTINLGTEVTPSQAAAAAAETVVRDRAAEQQKRFEDSYNIVDPGRVQAAPEQPPEEKPQAGAKPKTLPGAVADGITDELLDRAADVGISADEARQTPPTLLRRVIARLERETSQDQEPEPQPAHDPQYQAWLQQQQQQQWDLPPLGQAQDGMEFDPALHQALTARDQHYQGILRQQQQELQQMRQAVEQQQQQLQARQQAENHRTLEQLFAKDEAYRDIFGEGSISSLEGTRHVANRRQVATLMDDMYYGALRRGQTPPDPETLYTRARDAIHGGRGARLAEQRISEQARDAANGRFIARPTSTTRASEDLPPGEERAVRAVAAHMRNRNAG